MSDRPWHKRYHSDALSGFIVLTLEERGAYQTLLDLIYDRGGPMPDNDALLGRYMGVTPRRWRQLRDSLIAHGKIRVDEEGNLTNDRAVSEIKNAEKTSKKLAENGKKGGQKKSENAKKDNENSLGAENLLGENDGISEARSQIEEDKPPLQSARVRADGEGDLFDQDEPAPAEPPVPPGKVYAFVGAVIRLTAPDLDRWRQTYHAIPDIMAELSAIDDWLRGKPDRQKDWFHIASGSLSRKHAQFMADRAASAPPAPQRERSPEELEAARQRLIERKEITG